MAEFEPTIGAARNYRDGAEAYLRGKMGQMDGDERRRKENEEWTDWARKYGIANHFLVNALRIVNEYDGFFMRANAEDPLDAVAQATLKQLLENVDGYVAEQNAMYKLGDRDGQIPFVVEVRGTGQINPDGHATIYNTAAAVLLASKSDNKLIKDAKAVVQLLINKIPTPMECNVCWARILGLNVDLVDEKIPGVKAAKKRQGVYGRMGDGAFAFMGPLQYNPIASPIGLVKVDIAQWAVHHKGSGRDADYKRGAYSVAELSGIELAEIASAMFVYASTGIDPYDQAGRAKTDCSEVMKRVMKISAQLLWIALTMSAEGTKNSWGEMGTKDVKFLPADIILQGDEFYNMLSDSERRTIIGAKLQEYHPASRGYPMAYLVRGLLQMLGCLFWAPNGPGPASLLATIVYATSFSVKGTEKKEVLIDHNYVTYLLIREMYLKVWSRPAISPDNKSILRDPRVSIALGKLFNADKKPLPRPSSEAEAKKIAKIIRKFGLVLAIAQQQAITA